MKMLLLAMETGKISENDTVSLIQTGLERNVLTTDEFVTSMFGTCETEEEQYGDTIFDTEWVTILRQGAFLKFSASSQLKLLSLFDRRDLITCISRSFDDIGIACLSKEDVSYLKGLATHCLLDILTIDLVNANLSKFQAFSSDDKLCFIPNKIKCEETFRQELDYKRMLSYGLLPEFCYDVTSYGIPLECAVWCERYILEHGFTGCIKQSLLNCIREYTV